MLHSYQNWARYPKMFFLSLGIFSLFYIIMIQMNFINNIYFGVWLILSTISIIAFIVFHYINIVVQLVKVSRTKNYREANKKMEDLFHVVLDGCPDEESKKFIKSEIQYLSNPVKRYIFIQGIVKKIEEDK